MTEKLQTIDLQIDHPEVDDLQNGFRAKSLKAHILSLIRNRSNWAVIALTPFLLAPPFLFLC